MVYELPEIRKQEDLTRIVTDMVQRFSIFRKDGSVRIKQDFFDRIEKHA